MKNIFMEVEYVGTNYFGFQLQDKKGSHEITVQEVLETALERLFKQKVRPIYSSRTDKGVHAKCQGVNIRLDTNVPFDNIKRALNIYLPLDVRVKKVKQVPLDFHSRLNARYKTYRYVIINSKEPSVFQCNSSWHINRHLNIQKMRQAAVKLVGCRDFGVLAKEAAHYKDCTRNLMAIKICKKGRIINIDVTADGFLRNMVRNIVALLVKAGLDLLKSDQIPLILAKKTAYCNRPAPAAGLFLWKIKYKGIVAKCNNP
jgi:tRNA pseudouridine38-40 synthase